MSNIATEAVEALTGVKFPSALSKDNPQVRHFVEGLFAHFFSEHQVSFNHEDVQWFLEIANAQSHWQATFLINEIIEVKPSDDFLAHLGSTPDSHLESNASVSPLTTLGCVPMATFKFYLHRILDKGTQSCTDPIHSIMLHFQQTDVS